MSNRTITYLSNACMITCVVQSNLAETVLEAAKNSGAQGATINYARGTGVRERLGLLGVTIDEQKEVIRIIVSEDQADLIFEAMFLAGIIMASTNLLFSVLAWSERSEILFAIAVIFDDIAAAFATVAFVAFISLLVDRTYTATQYALLASIGTAGRTTLASSSGALVDWLNGDWGIFFIFTALMVIPSLIILWIMRNKLKLNEK